MPDAMQVWLPVRFVPGATKTGFSDFPDQQLDAVCRYFRAVQPELVCPEPLGFREIFRWKLREDLGRGVGDLGALADFAIILEAVAYGLLTSRTYDLGQYGFRFHTDSERYLTVLNYRASPGASETVAGFFSPTTLVCPAAHWKQRNALRDHVQRERDTHGGNSGRALLQLFHARFRAPEALWWRAMDWVLKKYQVAAIDPGEGNQSNVGPLLLELAPGNVPQIAFIPSYYPNRLSQVVHHLHGVPTAMSGDGDLAIVLNNQQLCTIVIPRADEPKLFGLGNIIIIPTTNLPADSHFDDSVRNLFKDALAPIVNSYAALLGDDNSRFRMPDTLRAVFFAIGERAGNAFLGGHMSRFTYSESLRAMGFQVLPHQGNITTGELTTTASGDKFFAEATPDGHVTFYIERWQGREVGELTLIGSSLWEIFLATMKRRDPLTIMHQRLKLGQYHVSVVEGATAVPPSDDDELSWSNFLYWIDYQPTKLLAIAAGEFANHHGLADVIGKKRTETAPIQIAHYAWLIAKQ